MADELRDLVRARAQSRCEYCRMHQSLQGATFHVEHVIPLSRGGANELPNLALACPSCNLHKSDRVTIKAEKSSEAIALFNPRQDAWYEHFDWDEYRVVAKTEIGWATISALELNHERRVKIREAEKMFGLFPPGSI